MDQKLLAEHVKRCRLNLRIKRITVCARCPFQEEIVRAYPDMKALFLGKQSDTARTEKLKRQQNCPHTTLAYKGTYNKCEACGTIFRTTDFSGARP